MLDITTLPPNVQVTVPLIEMANFFRGIVREEVRAKVQEELADQMLSPDETRKLFTPAISLPTLNSYAEKGYFEKYHLEGRTWYKRSEVLAALKTLKKYSRKDLANQ